MTEDKLHRLEIYNEGLYGIWTEGFRINDGSNLDNMLGWDGIEGKNIYISGNKDIVVFEVTYSLDRRVQKFDLTLVNRNKQAAEQGLGMLISLIGLQELEDALTQKEVIEASQKLNVGFEAYQKFFIGSQDL